jgi:RNA polymerase sigma-54 factor
MGIELKQNLRQTQSLLLSPQIQQAIKILTLGRAELQEYVSEELKENPCLEESANKTSESLGTAAEIAVGTGANSFETSQSGEMANGSAADFDPSLADLGQALMSAIGSSDTSSSYNENPEYAEFDTPLYEKMGRQSSNLHDEIEDQLRMMHLTDHELSCALTVLQYVNDDGYLSCPLTEVASENSLEADDCLSGLQAIQRCEPTGVGARDLQECLLLQIRAQSEIPALVERIVSDYWTELERVDIKKIARGLKADLEDVKDAINFIRSELDPKPARQFGDGDNHVVEPDVYIFMRAGKWVVSLNEDGLPRLKVSKEYEKLIESISIKGRSPQQSELKNFVNTRIKSAKWLVRALAERNKTILRVTEVLTARQSEFLERGVEFLRPMTLKNIAEELGLHESTISRTTTNKYVQTPQGLFELKYFFNSAMAKNSGEQLASETIRVWVAEMIRNEDAAKPLSDQDIANVIATTKNLNVARRTVAKYREGMGIPSSSHRVRKF